VVTPMSVLGHSLVVMTDPAPPEPAAAAPAGDSSVWSKMGVKAPSTDSWLASAGLLVRAAIGPAPLAGPRFIHFPPRGRHALFATIGWFAVLLGVLALVWLETWAFGRGDKDGQEAATVAVLVSLSLAWLGRSPLIAWRLQTVALLFLALAGGSSVPWPWSVTALVLYGAVLYLVAKRYDTPLLVGVWIWSVLALLASRSNAAAWLVAALAAVVAAILVLASGQASRARAEAALETTSAERDAASAEKAVLAERTRIARELHDVVAHHMSMIAVQAEAAPLRVPDLPPEAVGAFEVIRDAAREALTETRGIVGLLRGEEPGEREPAPRIDRIADLADRTRATGTAVDLRIEGNQRSVPAGVELAAYRIVQEGLSNAVRHSPGAAVDVRLDYRETELVITVRNAGPATLPCEVADGPANPVAPPDLDTPPEEDPQ